VYTLAVNENITQHNTGQAAARN